MRPPTVMYRCIRMRNKKVMRAIFHWKYSSVLIPLWFCTGVTLLLGTEFRLAVIFFALFGLWALFYHLNSDYLRKLRTKLGKRETLRNENRLRNATRRYKFVLYGVGAFWLVITGLCLWWAYTTRRTYELDLPYGRLIPANDPDPYGLCHPTGDQVALYLGSDAIVTDTFPQTIVEVGGFPAVILNREPDGSMGVSLDIRSGDGKLITQFLDNQFTINRITIFRDLERTLAA